jgi:hypothetical protein
MERTHLANVAGEAFDPLWTRWISRHRAAVRGSAPGSGTAVARYLNGLQGQLTKSSPLHPGRSEVGSDAKAAVEIRTVDAPPAADVALIDS